MNKKISIIIPSFNQGIYIEKTITSILDQNYPEVEIIIIDGGSTDTTIDVIKKYEKQIAYWVSEPDNGQSDAINKGLILATGEICNWLCSDDYLEPGSLNEINKAFQDPDINAVSGKIRVFDNDKIDFIKDGTVVNNSLEETIAISVNVQPATFFRLNHFKQCDLLSRELHYFMDKELWIKYLFENGQSGFKYINKVIAHYLLHPQSKTFQEMDPDMYNPASKFKIDNNTIFYQMASQHGFIPQAECIKKLTNSLVQGYKFNPISAVESELVEKIICYYLFHEAKKNFYKENFKMTKEISRVINTKFLPSNYQKDLRYLKRKSIIKNLF